MQPLDTELVAMLQYSIDRVQETLPAIRLPQILAAQLDSSRNNDFLQDFKDLHATWLVRRDAEIASGLHRYILQSRELTPTIDTIGNTEEALQILKSNYETVSDAFKTKYPELSDMVEGLFDKPLLDG